MSAILQELMYTIPSVFRRICETISISGLQTILKTKEASWHTSRSNHAPTLLSAQLKDTKGKPHLGIKMAVLPGEVADLHSMSGSSVRTEVWMRRVGGKGLQVYRV